MPMTTTRREEPTALDDLEEIRRTLQDAGFTLLQAATAVVSAAAKDTLAATTAVIAAADDTLAAAEEKVRKLRADLRKKR
jgi:uncharacterized radical SAM superfamily Fe-S cluster-containing enzyme